VEESREYGAGIAGSTLPRRGRAALAQLVRHRVQGTGTAFDWDEMGWMAWDGTESESRPRGSLSESESAVCIHWQTPRRGISAKLFILWRFSP